MVFISDIIDEMNKMINDIQKEVKKSLIGDEIHLENLHFVYPYMNIYKRKTDDGADMMIIFHVPGLNKEDITVEVIDDNTLEVTVKYPKQLIEKLSEIFEFKPEYSEFSIPWFKKIDDGENKDKYLFKRKIVIPNIKEENIKAELINGLLFIKITSQKRINRKQILLD